MKINMSIFYWLLGLFIIYLIIELLRKMFGGSLGFEELVVGLLIANIGYVISLNNSLNNKIARIDTKIEGHISWHRGHDSKVKN